MRISHFEARVELTAGADPWVRSEQATAIEEEWAASLAEAAAQVGVEGASASSFSPEETEAADLEFRRRVTLLIDGVPLIELVRRIELPFAEREYDERLASGESADLLGPRGRSAGDYMYQLPRDVFLPAHNLLGATYYRDTTLVSDDRRHGKSVLLVCNCGNSGCRDLLATITLHDETVTWSDFCRFERDWQYDLGPFTFDRWQYESELVPR